MFATYRLGGTIALSFSSPTHWHTHTLARTSVEQIDLFKQEQSLQARQSYHIAADCLLKVQADLSAIQQSIVNGTFESKLQLPVYPNNWTDVTKDASE